MIPVRIEVEGFLCYRDKQVVDLDGCDLWVLSGRNGSGKSSIFDAVTYALFKAHRGGKREAGNLIHAEADGFSVAFEFLLNGERYRLKRGLSRSGRATRQLCRHAPSEGADQWPCVPETDTDKGLERWIDEHIGFSFETFTASVLLMQGQAERLIGSQPKERHAILAGLADLAKYEDLHARADRRRLARKAEFDAAQRAYQAIAEVSDADLDAAEGTATSADSARAEAEAAWQERVRDSERAATWRDLEARRAEAIARRDRAEAVLKESATIARDLDRLRDLEDVLPSLREAAGLRGQIESFDADTARRARERDDADHKLESTARLAEENKRRLDALLAEIADDEARKADVRARGESLRDAVDRAKAAREARQVIATLDAQIAAYPPDLGERVGALEESLSEAIRWQSALPVLNNFAKNREALGPAREAVAKASAALSEARSSLAEAESLRDAKRSDLERAAAAESSANDRYTEAATRRDDLARRIEGFQGLRDQPTCDRCGQRLTPGHYEAEAARLEEEAGRARLNAERAEGVLKDARDALDSAHSTLAKAEARREAANRAVESARRASEAADSAHRQCESSCREFHDALADEFRLRIATEPPIDWHSTEFPTREQLEEGRRIAGGIEDGRRRIAEMRGQLDELKALRVKLQGVNEALAKADLRPGDETAEAEREALAVEYKRLEACLKGHAAEKNLAEGALERLAACTSKWARIRAEADKALAVAANSAQNARDRLAHFRSGLPESWRDPFDRASSDRIDAWEAEAIALRKGGIEALAEDLARAEIERDQARSLVGSLERQIAEIPESARITEVAATHVVNEARARLDLAGESARSARSALDELRRRKTERETKGAEARAAEARHAVAQRLAGLLGRDALQRHLLRTAERGILDRANPILRDISGGELQLRPLESDGAPEHALAIVAEVRTHGRTQVHEVAFLSGSQKFRVAVSLALAIGQYARGKRERPIESVVIDEGFGCLDRQGRDEMIAQLKALKGRLARIVLVSHQEDFAGAFPDGYRFEIVDGTTIATPFHE